MGSGSVEIAVSKIFSRIREIGLKDLDISVHSLEYLKKYRNNATFFTEAYTQLLKKAVKKLTRPINESSFIDYGGGCGILSLIAREAGFRRVVYNDLFKPELNDARRIATSIDIVIDYYICGDAGELVNEIKLKNIEVDLICSFDVLEHIYNFDNWINTVYELNSFSILFMTSANPDNPYIRRRLRKIHYISENLGCKNNIRNGDVFNDNSFLKEREIIIRNIYPELSDKEIYFLSEKCRGLMKDGIEKVVSEYISTGMVSYHFDHPTNTCEPYTGNWAERLIDLEQLKLTAEKPGLKVRITNSLFCYSGNAILNITKYLINIIISLASPEWLLISPAITVEIDKRLL